MVHVVPPAGIVQTMFAGPPGFGSGCVKMLNGLAPLAGDIVTVKAENVNGVENVV